MKKYGEYFDDVSYIITLSTQHLTEATKNKLDNDELDEVAFYEKAGWGWFVYAGSPLTSATPADIRECIEYAVCHGIEWIMFDADGMTNRNLPIYL